MPRALLLLLVLAGGSLAAPAASAAQEPAPDTLASRDPGPLFDRRDAYIGAGFVAGTVAMFPLDRWIADELQEPDAQANRFIDRTATGVEALARPGAFLAAGGLYAAGKLTGTRSIADIGLHGLEALVFADLLTRVIKGVAGRGRPPVVGIDEPSDFDLLRGFTDKHYQAFPSGHTASAFAAATVLTSEIERWWPEAEPYADPLLYGTASLVALARMYNNRHWASDVLAGAAVGTFSGWKVVRYNHQRPDNRLDRWLLGLTVTPGPGGELAIGYVW